VVIMLAIEPKVRGFKPGRGLRTFNVDKNPYKYLFRGGSEAVDHML
jgi:hypothetical protein